MAAYGPLQVQPPPAWCILGGLVLGSIHTRVVVRGRDLGWPKRKKIADFGYTLPHWHGTSGSQPVTHNIHYPWVFTLIPHTPLALLCQPWAAEATIAASQVPWHTDCVLHSSTCMSAVQCYHLLSRAEHCNSAVSLSWLISTSPVLNESWLIERQ